MKTTAICPSCGALWKPTLEERIAAKSDSPDCFVCLWVRVPEGRQGAQEMGTRLAAVAAGCCFAGPGSSSTVPTTPKPSNASCVDPQAVLGFPDEVQE